MDKHATTILLVPTWANRRSGTQKSDPWSIDCRQQVACVEWKTAPQLLQWKGVGRTISSILIQMSRLPIPEATKKPTATEEERVPWVFQWHLRAAFVKCAECLHSVHDAILLKPYLTTDSLMFFCVILHGFTKSFSPLTPIILGQKKQITSSAHCLHVLRSGPSILPRAQRPLCWTISASSASWSCPLEWTGAVGTSAIQRNWDQMVQVLRTHGSTSIPSSPFRRGFCVCACS